ncbi:type VII secretion protein EccCa [Spirilliplanes yamanashiensis]|uniref:Type VII secretion protein EccC n=1 Tax=Spirilliplanes yamanashiensis TaxID=42233 RepID=A0A8J4DJJ4_9ACTN|nr:type VII secretion protein EccCa [Spirilliplanes yamanashiensis]MDP9817288.1 S-DNA-T family DNA segregation ATPase FtsK/SpoIIIE [Spirilliplanes yamanashiensis]GIJ03060.1 type VII secretion protein EccC [Spirilliplanes yamanashiensis]
MSTVTVKRPPRAAGPEMPDGQVELQEPPVMAEEAPPDFRSFFMMVPMGLGMGGMMLMYGVTSRSPVMYVMGGVMALGMISMGLMQIGRAAGERKRKMLGERRDFLRYIAQLRRKARETAEQQRQAVVWNNPDPTALWSIAMSSRLWERRAANDDFGRVRIGLGRQRSAVDYVPPSTKPIEDLEPLSSISLRRFAEAYRTVPDVPVSVGLHSFSSVEFAGEPEPALGLLRAMIGQLVTFHAPDELRVAVLCDDAVRQAEWDWVKWLPHNAHPSAEDAAGPLRLFAGDHDELMTLLGPEVGDRGDHDKSVRPSVTEPFVVVVAHRAAIPAGSRLLGGGIRNVVLLDATGALPGGPRTLRLTVAGSTVEFPAGDTTGSAARDELTAAGAESLARVLAPKRTSGTLEIVDEPMTSDFELTTLLGIRDAQSFDLNPLWRARQPQRARLQVPIGVTEDGEVVELDLKESAQGGMGPHGLIIGATGSGKSELLRTLVCALAATHSSEILNLVLVDFKGGATFLGMERLPHTSAVITNLQDELPLVDRMQDALNGEMNRRQELLRASGYASVFDYEKARAGGAALAPFPVLLLIVDEFSELLSSKAEFMDLFVSIGRLGRSLGVHLLLASQRLDEGRINRVEGHLSYRIALRTFSSMESRAVIGVGSAYELPSAPGSGYLKMDTSNLIRFKGAYVSGPYVRTGPAEISGGRHRVLADVVPFSSYPQGAAVTVDADEPVDAGRPDEAAEAKTGSDAPMLMDVLVDRLQGSGPPARQIWLPPLDEAPSLDSLLPTIVPDPERGMTVEPVEMRGRLRVPVGVVDRPHDQMRDLLIADLEGADGHIGIAGAPQSGKSTLLRSLVLSLALSNTPEEVQFYGLDFGGGGIMSLVGLPHVGSIASRMEHDRVVRTIEEVRQVMEYREALFAERGFDSIGAYLAARRRGEVDDPHGHVFLMVDGWFTVKQDFPDLEKAFSELTSRGLSFGIHVVVTATRWSEIRPWLRDLLGTKFELRLGEAMESEIGSRKAALVPNRPGRGMTAGALHFLGALPRVDGSSTTGDLAEATKSIVEEIGLFWPGRPAPQVRMLPARLPVEQLPAPKPAFAVCIGRDEQRLAEVWHDFMVTPHMIVMGDNETGKTNALRVVLRAIQQRFTPDEAKVVLADTRRDLEKAIAPEYRAGYAVTAETAAELAKQAGVSMGRRMPGQDITSDRLKRRDWWTGPELFFVIDDYELFTGGMSTGPVLDPLMPMLSQGANIGLHLVIARSTSGAMRAMMDPAIRRMWELGTPVTLLSYPKDEGRFVGEATPRKLPPGRAQLVTRRNVSLIQTGWVDAGER